MGKVIPMPRAKHDYWSHYRIAFDKEMGKRFAHARVNMGLNQCQLASLLGVSHDHVCRIELGKTEISHFNALAFHSVFRGRVEFILFSVDADRYGYRTEAELVEISKKWVRAVGGRQKMTESDNKYYGIKSQTCDEKLKLTNRASQSDKSLSTKSYVNLRKEYLAHHPLCKKKARGP